MEDEAKFYLKNRFSNLISFRMNGKMTLSSSSSSSMGQLFMLSILITKLFQLSNICTRDCQTYKSNILSNQTNP